jgi:cytoskeletal protein CcmA (bactofilin family)
MADEADDLGIPNKLVRPGSIVQPAGTAADASRTVGERPADPAPQPLPAFLRSNLSPAVPDRPSAQSTKPPTAEPIEPRSLFVGPDISLSGEINACERLVVEGSIQANLRDCQSMIIRGTGSFNGSATIEDAEVYGRFEGDLVAHKRLLIRTGGLVCGTITYGQIEIEIGGKISGSVAAREYDPRHSAGAE